MDERDLEAEHAAPRRLVYQLRACLREMRERGADVLDLVGDVVHPRAALGEEPAHRRVVVERAQQLEPALSDADGRSLDALLLHTGALLEPRAEEAFVGVERTVEIRDGETDMVHGGRSVHRAIVFERLAPTMRASVFALVVAAALLAGCGGSSKAAKSNGEAAKTPGRVMADAKAAATSASSAHVLLDVNSDGTAVTGHVSMVRGKGATGSASFNGAKFDLVRVGNTLYIHGTQAFYLQFAGKAIAQLLHGKWVKILSTEPQFESFAAFTDLSALVAKIGSGPDKLVNDGEDTYRGTRVVAIRDTSDNSKLYVAATGKPYPVALVGGKKTGAVAFGDWNKHVSLTAPSGAIDISKFGG
jgi:hypothetical protein